MIGTSESKNTFSNPENQLELVSLPPLLYQMSDDLAARR